MLVLSNGGDNIMITYIIKWMLSREGHLGSPMLAMDYILCSCY
jgi:hypothetical protein